MHFFKNKLFITLVLFSLTTQSINSWVGLRHFIVSLFIPKATDKKIVIISSPIKCDQKLKDDYLLQKLIRELHAGIKIQNEATLTIITHVLCDISNNDNEDTIAEKIRRSLRHYYKCLNLSITDKIHTGEELTDEERDFLRKDCCYIRTPKNKKPAPFMTFRLSTQSPY